jgi:hypothetical protein
VLLNYGGGESGEQLPSVLRLSRKNVVHHRAVDVGQSEMATLEHVGEPFVIDAQLG